MKFIFDLDGTITAEETIPLIGRHFKIDADIIDLTTKTVKGQIPFMESFIRRVNMLSHIDPSEISELLSDIKLNEGILDFINKNHEKCIVATGNYRGWIAGLSKKIKCEIKCSEGIWLDGKLKLTEILIKEDLVKKIKESGEDVIYIGDGNNDAEAMRYADIGVACGIVHQPAESVLQVCDFAIYDDKTLAGFLNQTLFDVPGETLILSCAGTGSRLGMGITKALLELNGKSLLSYNLENFKSIDDLRIVVGFQSKEVISEVISIRKNVIFAFNHNYFNTKNSISLALASRFCRTFVIAYDGDFLTDPDDVSRILKTDGEFLCCVRPISSDPIYCYLDEKKENILGFGSTPSDQEWSGPAKIKKDKIKNLNSHLYEMLNDSLPLPVMLISGTDIDTYEDYTRAQSLAKVWYSGNRNSNNYYGELAKVIVCPLQTRNKSPDFTNYDVDFIKSYVKIQNCSLLELGAGTGLMTNRLHDQFSSIVAVEKYPEFSAFINKVDSVSIINADLLDLCNIVNFGNFDFVILFGVMNFFNKREASLIYKFAYNSLKPNGKLIVKHNMGIAQDVHVNGHSKELDSYYYSEYRCVENELKLIKSIGLQIDEVVDIYPDEFNRWKDTHFYAIVCTKIC